MTFLLCSSFSSSSLYEFIICFCELLLSLLVAKASLLSLRLSSISSTSFGISLQLICISFIGSGNVERIFFISSDS
ncbi:unnamed protein product [Schistosoma curassoni]|uniref:Secreted protein n=1 Tax=Schistosoma curassoni TaxID=6186 RepID=A0A183K6U9_9TREM|nr:unnamed protein product [Schistosoma curassoni]